METVSISTVALFGGRVKSSPFPRLSPQTLPPQPPLRKTLSVFAFKTSSSTVSEPVEDDVLHMFLKDREANGDFISKVFDRLWLREFVKSVDGDANEVFENRQTVEEIASSAENDDEGGFLKLKQTQEWVSGEKYSAPMNKKATAKAMRDDSERQKKLNLLKYEALKRELMLLSVGVGTACSGYCLVVFSLQAAISYSVGVLCSCLYLQLLYQYADNISKEMVPQIFMQKKAKTIGIRSEDLKNFFERSIKGTGLALSSPRLVIPAAIYGLWALSHKYLENDFFDFQIVPAMMGMFVYKAAALVQVYRDNQDLQFIFPENQADPSD